MYSKKMKNKYRLSEDIRKKYAGTIHMYEDNKVYKIDVPMTGDLVGISLRDLDKPENLAPKKSLKLDSLDTSFLDLGYCNYKRDLSNKNIILYPKLSHNRNYHQGCKLNRIKYFSYNGYTTLNGINIDGRLLNSLADSLEGIFPSYEEIIEKLTSDPVAHEGFSISKDICILAPSLGRFPVLYCGVVIGHIEDNYFYLKNDKLKSSVVRIVKGVIPDKIERRLV